MNAFLASDHRPRSCGPKSVDEPMNVDVEPPPSISAAKLPDVEHIVRDSGATKLKSEPVGPAKHGDAGDSGPAKQSTGASFKPEKAKPAGEPRKAKAVRFEKSLKKTMQSQNCDEETARRMLSEKRQAKLNKNKPKTLEEWLFPAMPAAPAHKLEVSRVKIRRRSNRDCRRFELCAR